MSPENTGPRSRFIGVPFAPRVLVKITARSVRKRPPAVIDPAVRALCDDLLAQFTGTPASLAEPTRRPT